MNTAFRQLFGQIPDRTKFLLVAAIAFALGSLIGGSHESNGRYLPAGPNGTLVLDTKTGTLWQTTNSGAYVKTASFPYF